MASRSTRRNQKNLEISKIDKCQNEEDSPEKKEPDNSRRRSLRHSPGSSLSPPRKTRKTNNEHSQSSNENNVSKCTQLSGKSHTDVYNNEIENTVLSSPIKLPRNSVNSPISESSQNSSLLNSSDTTKSSPDGNLSNETSLCNIEQEITTSRRSSRNKTNISLEKIPKDKVVENKLVEPVTPKVKKGISINVQEIESPSTSHSQVQVRKRSLPKSPEGSSSDHVNGKEYESQNKRSRVSADNSAIEMNGKEVVCNDNSLISLNCSELATLSLNTNNSCENSDVPKETNSEISHSDNFKIVVDNSTDSKIKVSNDIKIIQEFSSIIISNDNMVIDEESENLLKLLDTFGLTEGQCQEICKILPRNIKESTHIDMLEVLVQNLLTETISLYSMSSPRYNKFLRQLLTAYCNSDTTVEKKHSLCESALHWSKERKSMNLRHELELALMTLYYDTKCYRKAEETANALYKETKKLQDKDKTVKACLCLSKAYHAMGNLSKARANITTAKTEALKIYTPPDLQADLDLQSGIMQVAEEKDMETAFSYFKEAATGFVIKKQRSRSLKYMLLAKLLINKPEEGEKAVRSKIHVEDIDVGVEAMLSITKAAVTSCLADFKKARDDYATELEDDIVVRGVLDQLYSKMLEKNLLTIVAPYDRLQITVVAERIGLARNEVERRLSQMILDGQITAQLDHRDNCLYVYKPTEVDKVFKHSLDSVSQLDKTVSLLNKKVKRLL